MHHVLCFGCCRQLHRQSSGVFKSQILWLFVNRPQTEEFWISCFLLLQLFKTDSFRSPGGCFTVCPMAVAMASILLQDPENPNHSKFFYHMLSSTHRFLMIPKPVDALSFIGGCEARNTLWFLRSCELSPISELEEERIPLTGSSHRPLE